jgi:acid phosphatase (class A)
MGSVGGFTGRPRYNTQVMTRFIDTSQPIIKPLVPNILQKPSVRYNQYWDADLQSYMYLQNFVKAVPGWMDGLTATALANGTQSQRMDPEQLDREIRQILDLAPEREERFAEIMDQDDADGATNYWFGMLQISPARHPATYLMVRVGRRIGEHVVMCLKGFFRSPRPSQLCPAIVPMIDPPSTPSFPAGHAVQAYLISYLLAYSLPKLPQQYAPEDNLKAASGVLFDLAERVSVNRVVAGLHYPTDIIAGRAVGIACFEALTRIDSLWSLNDLKGKLDDFCVAFPGGLEGKSLRALVQDEFPQYV